MPSSSRRFLNNLSKSALVSGDKPKKFSFGAMPTLSSSSITGRKDFLSTENVLDLESLLAELGTSYNDSLLGEDGVSPDYDGVVDAWDDYFRNKYTFEFSTEYTERWADEIASSGTHFNHGFLGINHMLANYDKEMLFPDYGVIKN